MSNHELGQYTGALTLESLTGERRVKTISDFGFLDADGKHWPVPPGSILDGESIPNAMWSLLGGPFEGKGCAASVVYDYYCSVGGVDWQSVQRMFYDAMVVSGVAESCAKLVCAGLHFMGPHKEHGLLASAQSRQSLAEYQTSPANILYAICRDPITLAVSEAIECDGASAFDWITSVHQRAEGNAPITLWLDKISSMVQEDEPSLATLEAAIDYALCLIPDVEGAPRRLSVGSTHC